MLSLLFLRCFRISQLTRLSQVPISSFCQLFWLTWTNMVCKWVKNSRWRPIFLHTRYLRCNNMINAPVVCLQPISTCWCDNIYKWRHQCMSAYQNECTVCIVHSFWYIPYTHFDTLTCTVCIVFSSTTNNLTMHDYSALSLSLQIFDSNH